MSLEKIKNNDNIISESKYIIKNPEENKNNWNKVFPKSVISEAFGDDRPTPIHIEIGMGDDSFILKWAQHTSEFNFIGIEKMDSLIDRAILKIPKYESHRTFTNISFSDDLDNDSDDENKKSNLFEAGVHIDGLVKGELENLKLIRYDEKDLLDIFGDEEISVIYLNFFDSRTKIKYHKQRLTARIFLDIYNKILKPDGKIVMKTDCMDLFEYSIESFSENGYIVRNVSLDLHNTDEFTVSTEYEEFFIKSNKPIYKVEAYKN